MMMLIKKIFTFFIYIFLLINVFIATVGNVFSDNIAENNARYSFAVFLLLAFYFRKSIIKLFTNTITFFLQFIIKRLQSK